MFNFFVLHPRSCFPVLESLKNCGYFFFKTLTGLILPILNLLSMAFLTTINLNHLIVLLGSAILTVLVDLLYYLKQYNAHEVPNNPIQK